MDISAEDLETDGEIASNDSEVEGTPGEAVLTSGEAEKYRSAGKSCQRTDAFPEQRNAQAIIDNANISEEEKKDAIAQMLQMTQLSEQEVAVETLMASKGFSESVVSLTADSADIVVNAAELTDAKSCPDRGYRDQKKQTLLRKRLSSHRSMRLQKPKNKEIWIAAEKCL